jgi:succinate dehydrogenase / fumarate reductase membrane anchor subunit
MNAPANFKTPRARAAGLGSAKDGVEHWWSHRIGSVALIPLVILAVPPLARTLGEGYEAVRATYGHPFNAIVMALLIIVTFRHLQHGLQTVVEDYVHHKIWRTGLIFANTWFCGLMTVAGLYGVGKLAFGA